MHPQTSVQFSCSVVSDSLQPQGLQPSRLLCPWDFPGKSTGVGCYCLLWWRGSVQSLIPARLFATPWTAAHQDSLSITNSQSLLKLMSIELVMPSNHLILCHPLLPLSIFPSIRVFSNESVLHISWPQDWSFSFSTRTYNVYSGLISFRMDWLNLLTVQGTLMSLLQHHSSKASILWCSAFFMVQLSHPYMTTSKNHSSDYMYLCWQSNISAF